MIADIYLFEGNILNMNQGAYSKSLLENEWD